MSQKHISLVLLSIFNTLLLVSGASIIIWTAEYDICNSCFCYAFEDFTIFYQTIFFICAILQTVISIFGFVGMLSGHLTLLKCYGKMLIFLMLLITIVLCMGLWGKGPLYLRSVLHNSFKSYGTGNCRLDASIDDLQSTFHCCGIDAPEDWTVQRAKQLHNVSLEPPLSCCSPNLLFRTHDDIKCITTYRNGCYAYVRRYVWNIISVATVVGFGLALLMTLSTICLFQLTKLMKEEQYQIQLQQNFDVNHANAIHAREVPLNLYQGGSEVKTTASSTVV